MKYRHRFFIALGPISLILFPFIAAPLVALGNGISAIYLAALTLFTAWGIWALHD